MNKVISNSTPLILLDKINHLHLLKELYRKVYVPQAVFDEISNVKYVNNIFKENDFIEVAQIKSKPLLYPTALHSGEIEVFTLAKETKASLCILDDLLARNYAVHLGLKITGTAGILLLAKELQLIENVKPLIDKLAENGFRISPKLYQSILIKANEMN